MTISVESAERAAEINTLLHTTTTKGDADATFVVLEKDGVKYISYGYGWLTGEQERPNHFPQSEVFGPLGYEPTGEERTLRLSEFQVTDALRDSELEFAVMLGMLPSPHYLLSRVE